eukprot:9729-Eustigmatos_ZCMA.PRE.1
MGELTDLDDTNTAEVVLELDYNMQPSKNRFQAIIRAKYLRLLPYESGLTIPKVAVSSSSSGSSGGLVTGLPVAEIESFKEGDITFEKPSQDIEKTSMQ